VRGSGLYGNIKENTGRKLLIKVRKGAEGAVKLEVKKLGYTDKDITGYMYFRTKIIIKKSKKWSKNEFIFILKPILPANDTRGRGTASYSPSKNVIFQ